MKKKVMHIVQSPGGVERYIRSLLSNIDLNKIDNILVCSHEYTKEHYSNLVTSFEYVDMIRNIDFKSDLRAIIKIRKLIKKYNPDIIYMHSSKAGAIGRIANIGIKNKSIYNPHGWAFNMNCSNKKKLIYRYIENILALFVDEIIAISDFEKESAIQNKICSPKKIRVIYNGIDIDDYKNKSNQYTITRRKIGIPEDAYIIGMVGRISEQKAPDTFVQVAAKVKDIIPEAFFIIVGDGDERKKIEKLIDDLDLKRSFMITGWVEEPMEYIELFDQAMLLSRWEGFGLVLAEYMVAEKPIIATNIDAIPNLIDDNVNGILIDVDQVEQAVKAIKELYENKEECQRMVTNSKNKVERDFDIRRVALQHEKIFESIFH